MLGAWVAFRFLLSHFVPDMSFLSTLTPISLRVLTCKIPGTVYSVGVRKWVQDEFLPAWHTDM